MNTFINISLASLLTLGTASTAFADMSSMFQFKGAFVGADYLYMEAMNGDQDYVTVFPSSNLGGINNYTINNDFHSGYQVFGGIKFGDMDDMTGSWTRLHTSDFSSITPHGATPGSSPLSVPRWAFEANWVNITGRASYDLDDAYLVIAHTINFNNPWSVRFGAGAEYSRIYSVMTVQNNFGPGFFAAGYEGVSDMHGVGPRVEADMMYHLPYGFTLFANGNVALLDSDRGIALNTLNAADGKCPSQNDGPRKVLIPKFGIKAGLSFSYKFCQIWRCGTESATTLTIEAGYQAESYVHAVERFLTVDSLLAGYNTTQGYDPFVDTKTSNYGYQGLFVNANINLDMI